MNGNNHHRNSAPCYGEAGEWLRKQREYWQITQAELAEQLGVREASVIAGIEQGEIALPSFMREAVAILFGVSHSELATHCEGWYGQQTAKAA